MNTHTAEPEYGKIVLETLNGKNHDKEQHFKRLLTYSVLLEKKVFRPVTFWDWESYFEKKMYDRLKTWEKRHPILGIILCTILGGVLISLLAEMILKAMFSVL